MIRVLISLLLLSASHFVGTLSAASVPPFPQGSFPMPTAEEMKEVEKMFSDPDFQKMFEGIMSDLSNDPSLDFLNPPSEALKAVTPTLDLSTDSKKDTQASKDIDEPFHASNDWRENFLYNFDAAGNLPTKDAKAPQEDTEYSFFKKKLPENAQKAKVKIPTSLKNAYARFCYALSTSVVQLKRIVASNTLGAHGHDQLHDFSDAASALLTNAFKALSKTIYMREFYLSSVENRKKMLTLLDEFELVAASIPLRDEEEDDFNNPHAETFRKQQAHIKKIKNIIGSMKTTTTTLIKTLDVSKEALEKKRKEREERAKKQAEKPQQSRNNSRFGSSSSGSSWDYPTHYPRNNNWGRNTGGGGNWGGGYDWGNTGSGGNNYWDQGHDHEANKAQPLSPNKPQENPASYAQNTKKDDEKVSETKKTLADIKKRLALALNNPAAEKLKTQANAAAMSPGINKFYLETDAPERFETYAKQLKALESDVATLELIAKGEFVDAAQSLLADLNGAGKKGTQPQKTKDDASTKEAKDLLNKWNAHIRTLYQASTNVALQAVEMPTLNRDIGSVVVLPCLNKSITEGSNQDLVHVQKMYYGIEYLREAARPYLGDNARAIDAKRKEEIISSIKSHTDKAKGIMQRVKAEHNKPSRSFLAIGKEEAHLLKFQDDLLRRHITPFTWDILNKDMCSLYPRPEESEKGFDSAAHELLQRVHPGTRNVALGTVGTLDPEKTQLRNDLYFWYHQTARSPQTKASRTRRDSDIASVGTSDVRFLRKAKAPGGVPRTKNSSGSDITGDGSEDGEVDEDDKLSISSHDSDTSGMLRIKRALRKAREDAPDVSLRGSDIAKEEETE